MINLIIKGQEQEFSNEEGLKVLRKNNPNEKFRIDLCEETEKPDYVIQIFTKKGWLCLHDSN